MRYCVQLKFLHASLRTKKITISVTTFNSIVDKHYQSTAQEPRIAAGGRENPQSESVTAYNDNPYMRYCVQRKSLYPLLRAIRFLMKIHNPRTLHRRRRPGKPTIRIRRHTGKPALSAKISGTKEILRKSTSQKSPDRRQRRRKSTIRIRCWLAVGWLLLSSSHGKAGSAGKYSALREPV